MILAWLRTVWELMVTRRTPTRLRWAPSVLVIACRSSSHARNVLQCSVIGLLTVCVVGSAFCQLPKLPKIERFGIDGFRLMLQQHGLRATQDEVGTAFDSPEETVAILLGDLTDVRRIAAQLNRFINTGGALLIATDVRDSPAPGAVIRATRPIAASDRQKLGYRGFNDCPIVTNVDRNSTPLFDGVSSIVTNRPGRLQCANSVKPIAWLPSARQPPLMAIYENGPGRLLVIADHSLFINEMLVHGDNAAFANNVCRWLCESGTRSKLVLVNEGKVLPDWSFGESPPAIPLDRLLRAVQRGSLGGLPIGESVLPVVNESVSTFQRQNGFNVYARRFANRAFGGKPIRIVMIIVTIILAALLVCWLLATRSRPRRWLTFQDGHQTNEATLGQSIRQGNHFPYLRVLVREFFFESGATGFERPSPPSVQTKVASQQSTIVRDIHGLWAVAAERSGYKMSKKTFKKKLAMLRRLRQLQLKGELRLEYHTEP